MVVAEVSEWLKTGEECNFYPQAEKASQKLKFSGRFVEFSFGRSLI